MGLLDDAIREHLELKRRHGASDEEIAQKEAEALGPARRDFPVPQQAEAEPEPVPEPDAVSEPEPVPEPDAVSEPEPDQLADVAAPVEPVPHDPLAEEAAAPTVVDEPEPEAEPEPEPVPFEDAPAAEEEEPEPQPSSGEDDVLEETPEFLQDAPEHDRLWFEQKPPRDFDFD